MKLAPNAFLTSFATGRGLVAAAATAIALGLVSHFVLVPAYHDVSGFAPFDVQFPLSPFAIAVELGGYAEGSATDAYLLFAVVDFAFAVAAAWLFTAAWVWLFSKVPTRLFAFLMRGGIFMVPFYAVVLDLAAKVGFFRLVRGLTGPSYAATIEFCTTVHRFESALLDMRYYLTAAFLLTGATELLMRQNPRRRSSGSAFPS